MSLSHLQRVAQAVIFYSSCDESLKEAAILFRVNARALQKAYSASYQGMYTY